MKKNDTKTIVSVAAALLVIGAVFYFGGRNQTSAPASKSNVAANPHNHNMTASVSLAALNDLVQKPASDFSLTDRDGNVYSSANLRGKNVILFFNEGLMCYPACWNQIVSLAKDVRFKNEDTVVLSVVVDSKEDWKKAINKMPELAKATVVFDTGAAVAKTFGVLSAPSSMHVGSLPGHTYVLIDKEGIVRYVFDDPRMGIRNDQLVAEIAKLK